MCNGDYHWTNMLAVSEPALTKYQGETAKQECKSISDVFHYLINQKPAFVNGDWALINTTAGLMIAASTHLCPLCDGSLGNFDNTLTFNLRRPPNVADTPDHKNTVSLHALDGPEMSKWLKRGCVERLLLQHSTTMTPAIIACCRK